MTPLLAVALPLFLQHAKAEWEETFPEVQVTVRAEHCGHVNAWYTFRTRTVTMCDELFDQPLLATWVFNHEMGHALNDQLDLPWVNAEDAADELAMLMSSVDESVAAAKWFMSMAKPSKPDAGNDGDHSAYLDRAAAILCYVDGVEATPAARQCGMYAKSVTAGWIRILGLVLPGR